MNQHRLAISLEPMDLQREVQPRRRGAKARRRRTVQRLLAEILAIPERQRCERLRQEERFLDRDLFDLLLEEAHAALPSDARRACELTALAIEIAVSLNERGLSGGETDEGLCRAYCLTGTARRLLGEVQGAERAFERAGHLAVSASECGFFCRAVGVLRWDQGRMEEAAALLHHAQRRFAERRELEEEAACFALLGLLDIEAGQVWRGAPFLQRAARELDTARRPWLAAQSWLGVAFCLASAGDAEKARTALRTARKLCRDVKEEESRVSLQWLEGRGVALAGDTEYAARLLDAVRRHLIGRRRLPAATLASIDLGLVWIGAGVGKKVSSLSEELRDAFEGCQGFSFAQGVMSRFAEDAVGGRIDRDYWSCMAPALRVGFRLQGVGLRPVPFA
jgi:tetratricopeptide (TPR) repeat protein